MNAASETGQLAELRRLMLLAASSPGLAVATWRYLAAELAATPGKPG